LHGLDLGEPAEEDEAPLRWQRAAVPAGLDVLAQPQALLVAGQVLDLVGDRPAVDVAQPGDDVGERRAGNVAAEDVRGDAAHELRRQPETALVEALVTVRRG